MKKKEVQTFEKLLLSDNPNDVEMAFQLAIDKDWDINDYFN